MFRLLLAGACALLCVSSASAAEPASLTVHVIQVSPRGGDVRVALYNQANYSVDDADPVMDSVVPAKVPETVTTLHDIKPGIYAIKLFQDFNRNAEFDQNWIGLPIEKYGFSNDARPTFSEPPFEATRFEIKPGQNTITIKLR